MSMVNDTYKFVFLHVAKTGGRSVNLLLKERAGLEGVFNTQKIDPEIDVLGRMLGLEAKAFAGDDRWAYYFTFAFSRNPWDRAVSIYAHMKTDYERFCSSGTDPEQISGKALLYHSILEALNLEAKDLTFDHFLHEVVRDKAFSNYHWDKQINALGDEDGRIIFDFVGRFERLQEDFDYACSEIGLPQMELPHYNKSKREHWKTYYNADTYKTLAKCYAEDIEILGYG